MNALTDNLIHRVNVGDTLTRSAARYPDRIAVVDGPRRITYAELDGLVNAFARSLLARGFSSGDRLALVSGNSTEFLVVYYACAKAGLICVPINLGWRAPEVAYVLGHSGARGVVVETQLVAAFEPALAEAGGVTDVIVAVGTGAVGTGADVPAEVAGRPVTLLADLTDEADTAPVEQLVGDRDPLTYLYTSGTTSAPKGVVGNHTAIYLESMAMALENRFAEDDRFVAMMPMFHTAQLNCFCTPAILLGATTYIHRAFDATDLLSTIEREQITQIFGLPMMYRGLLDHPAIGTTDLSSLRRACYAMAPMPQAQLEQALQVFGCDFYLLFGQTEMSPTTTIFRPEHQLSHPGAVGTSLANIQVGIMAADGTLLDRGQQGEIVYRGPQALTAYLDDPEATERAFAHGWFHSGDNGYLGDDGVLWFTDRAKDVIKSGGENVASMEVEKAVYAADPHVGEVAVIGLPHERWSEAITAIVVPRPGETIDADALLAGVRTHIDAYKVPKSVVAVTDLPRTSTGKIQKNVLRERFADHYVAGTDRSPATAEQRG